MRDRSRPTRGPWVVAADDACRRDGHYRRDARSILSNGKAAVSRRGLVPFVCPKQGPKGPDRLVMNTLSRREEDTLLKQTKTSALKECDPVVKGKALTSHVFSTVSDSLYFRICAVRRRAHFFCSMGVQAEVQGGSRLHASVVSVHLSCK